jgi:hypothetical protein
VLKPLRLAKELAQMPLGLFMFSALATLPVGLLAALIAGIDQLLGLSLLQSRITSNVLIGIWIVSVLVANYFAVRSWLPDFRGRLARNAPFKIDLAGGVKQCETLPIEEALCVQENEHQGLGYFCRVADGRVVFVLDYESASWEDEDLAEGYRRGVDPRQERFVPKSSLHVCRAPASGFVFDEEFNGDRVPLVEGIYWTDVERLPESGSFVDKSWKSVLAKYKREKDRVDWTEVIARAAKQAATV